jgi:hypothetical protein
MIFVQVSNRYVSRKRYLRNGSYGKTLSAQTTALRNLANFMVNLEADLLAYCHQSKKPSLHLVENPMLEPIALALLTLVVASNRDKKVSSLS